MTKQEIFEYELGRMTFFECCLYSVFFKLFLRKVTKRFRLYQKFMKDKQEQSLREAIYGKQNAHNQ